MWTHPFVISHMKRVCVWLTYHVGLSMLHLDLVSNSSTVDVVATRTTLKRRRPVNSVVSVSISHNRLIFLLPLTEFHYWFKKFQPTFRCQLFLRRMATWIRYASYQKKLDRVVQCWNDGGMMRQADDARNSRMVDVEAMQTILSRRRNAKPSVEVEYVSFIHSFVEYFRNTPPSQWSLLYRINFLRFVS